MKIVLITTDYSDYLANNLREGLLLVNPSTVVFSTTKPVVTKDLEDADWIVLTTGPAVPKVNLTPFADKVAIVDGADEGRRVLKDVPHRVYFKREAHDDSVFPFSFCVREEIVLRPCVPWEKRNIDIFYAAHLPSNPIRQLIWNRLEEMKQKTKYNIVLAGHPQNTRMAPHLYLEALEHSKIFISPRGAGQDTNNYWEAPAVGTLLLAQRRTIRILNNFEDGEEAVFFDTVDQMEERIHWLMGNDGDCEMIARGGQCVAFAYHKSKSRAQQLINRLERII